MSSFGGLVSRATGALTSIAGRPNERLRQQVANDGFYDDAFFCFFELRSPLGSFLFPLIGTVQAYTLQEPFAVDIVPTDFAGLGVHRQGIVQRRLQISGHTGFAPRRYPVDRLLPRSSVLPRNYTSRNLGPYFATDLSGQRIFELLQEEVFRAYSDLCRDPATAGEAALYFHNVRDREHWQVEPMAFSLQRGAQSNYTYPFSIDMTIVGPAAATTLKLPEADKGVMDLLRDGIGSVTEDLDGLRGAIQDIISIQGSFRVLGQQAVGIIDSASYVVQAATAFVNGTQAAINLPRAAVFALFNACTDICALFASLVDIGTSLADWPRSVVGGFRRMQNACDALLVQTGAFQPPLPVRLQLIRGTDDQAPAVNVVRSASFDDLRRAGTASTPGEVTAALGARTGALGSAAYRSVREVTVQQGDTLHRIAARELGSTSAWRDIAVLNDLSAPYTAAGERRAAGAGQQDQQSGALTYGQKLLVPSTDDPPAAVANAAVLGVAPEAGQDEQTFGRDLRLKAVGQGAGDVRYDLDLASDGGLPDLATQAGVDQLTQAVEQHVVQGQGSSPLFPQFGLAQLVGTGYAQVDDTLRNFRISQALQADPRVSSVEKLQVTLGGPGQVADALFVDATVVAVGRSGQAQVGVAI